MNHGPLNSTANSSAPSVGASSLVTDANSGLSGGHQLQRSTSINNESYMRLPASPMSFSSNNISGSSVMDGSSIIQQSPHQEHMKQGDSMNTTHAIKQEPGINFHAQKKPRLDSRQDDFLQQQVIHQLLQRQGSLQLQGHQNPELNALIQQQRLAQQRQQHQQHQILQSLPHLQPTQHLQRAPLMNQQIRPNNMQVQAVPPVRRPTDSGLCARRLMQYMYHQRHRPTDNSILYWRKFVAEYFAPKAKKRWCLSLYENVGSQALGAFPQAAMDAWQCDICGSKTGKGFEATYEVLPRLNQIKFDRGVVDELLFLDMPRECRLSSGMMVLEYAKAVQESVYEQVRVVREGQLRITFTPDLKILLWEFCARRHEEFFSRRAIVPQVNQLLQVVHKYQTAVNESGPSGLPVQDLQASCNMFMAAGRQLVRSLELQSLNDLGFSKRYVRCLQISEVVNSMKDLIDFSQESKVGPIESLKSYPRQAAAKLQAQKMQEMEQMAQSLSADQNSLNKIMAMRAGINNQTSNPTAAHIMNNNAPNGVALSNYQYLLRNSPTSNNDPLPPSPFSNPNNQLQPSHFLTKSSSFNSSTSNQQQQQQPPSNISFPHQNSSSVPSQVNQQFEQHVIQQLLQEMMNNKGAPQQTASASNANGASAATERAVGPARMNTGPMRNNDSGVGNNGNSGIVPSRSNSFKSAANNTSNNNNNDKNNNNNSSSSSSSFNGKPDLLQNLHLPELDQDILREFTESGIQW